jgi:Domain of unknown function (DUF4388)
MSFAISVQSFPLQYSQGSIIPPAGTPSIMGIVGNLKTMQLEELLQWLSLSKKTGTLEINHAQLAKKIYFRDGLIVSSSSNRPEEYLGHFLVSHGLITEEALTEAVQLQKQTHVLLGKILVNQGLLTEDSLHQMLRLKTEESIYDVFYWEEGDFGFLDDQLPESAMVPMSLDVTGILMEGVQRVDEFRRIRKLIPNQQAIPVVIAELSYEDLDAGERQVLDLVDDERTVEEIRLQTHSSEFHVCRVLYRQWQEGRVKVVKARVRNGTGAISATGAMSVMNTGAFSTTGVALAAPSSPAGPPTASALVDAARGFLGQQSFESALRHLRAARCLEPENQEIGEMLSSTEKSIRDAVESSGVKLSSIPQLAVTFEQLTSSKLSPQEGFMLTRINGSYDIQSILKITPMPQLDALLLFWKLSKEGFVKLKAGKAK